MTPGTRAAISTPLRDAERNARPFVGTAAEHWSHFALWNVTGTFGAAGETLEHRGH